MKGVGTIEQLLRPRSIAVVGAAPNEPGRQGSRTLYDLSQAEWGGRIYPVTERHQDIYGHHCYASLALLPEAPDVVLARIPGKSVLAVARQAGEKGARHFVVLASGFAESGAAGRHSQQALVDLAHAYGMRVLGPQSTGLYNMVDRIPMSLAQLLGRVSLRGGNVGLLVQSGAMAGVLSARGQGEFGIDFSYIVTFGNAADLSPTEVMEFLIDDPHTKVIAIYLEGVQDGRAFMAAALRALDAGKPVVVLRSGLSQGGSAVVQSHTASMTGDREVFESACRQSGVCLTTSTEEFLQAVTLFRTGRRSFVRGIGFASISGAACALFSDHTERVGLTLAALESDTVEALGKCLPAFLKPGNPQDLGPVVFDDIAYARALRILLEDTAVDVLVAYLFTSVPEQVNSPRKIALLGELARETDKPVLAIWEAALPEERTALSQIDGIATYTDIRWAVDALARFRTWSQARATRSAANCREMDQVPLSGVAIALPSQSGPISEYSGKCVLRAAGMPVPQGVLVQVVEEAMQVATALGFPVAMKIQSALIGHKTEIGGVRLAIDSAEMVAAAWPELVSAAGVGREGVPIEGVLVEGMIDEAGIEIIVAAHRDPQFGIVVTVGAGGTAVELHQDVARFVGRPTHDQAHALLAELHISRLLTGFRGDAGYDTDALANLMVRLGSVMDEERIGDIELNPVKVLRPRRGAVILDCLMTLH